MLSIRDIHKSHSGSDSPSVIAGLSLELAPREVIAIMGESGVGKSTLLNLIAGLDRADSGSIEMGGLSLHALSDNEATLFRRRAIGFVFQAFHVLPYLNVADNIALSLRLNDWPADEAMARTAEMLTGVGLSSKSKRRPSELSGGELQRVAIARAIAHRPALVLADEPTGNLDPETADQVLGVLHNELRRNGAAAIIVTHSLRTARIADRVLTMRRDGLYPVADRARDAAVAV